MTRAPWPSDPDGDMVPILEASIEAAKRRHPSGKAVTVNATTSSPPVPAPPTQPMDRCDACSAAAMFRAHRYAANKLTGVLDMCGHHWRKHSAAMFAAGWLVVSGTPAFEEA